MPAVKIVKRKIKKIPKKDIKESSTKMAKKVTKTIKITRSTGSSGLERKKSSKASSGKGKMKKIEDTKACKVSISKFGEFICEAIAALETKEDKWVSGQKIAQYLIDFYDKGLWQTFKKKAQNVLEKLKDQKLLKAKKNKYAFTSLGEKKLKPDKIPKHKKIEGRVKKREVEKAVEEPPPIFTKSGRESKPVVK
jgi:hypothetical protein